jgi:Sel1 repeat
LARSADFGCSGHSSVRWDCVDKKLQNLCKIIANYLSIPNSWGNIAMLKIALFVISLFINSSAFSGFDEGLAAYKKGDFATALNEWQPLAEQGDAHAQFNLGLMYTDGQGVTKDDAQAVQWYRKAAKQGNEHAKNNLSGCSRLA